MCWIFPSKMKEWMINRIQGSVTHVSRSIWFPIWVFTGCVSVYFSSCKISELFEIWKWNDILCAQSYSLCVQKASKRIENNISGVYILICIQSPKQVRLDLHPHLIELLTHTLEDSKKSLKRLQSHTLWYLKLVFY